MSANNVFILFSKRWNAIKNIRKECAVVVVEILKIWHSKKIPCYFELIEIVTSSYALKSANTVETNTPRRFYTYHNVENPLGASNIT